MEKKIESINTDNVFAPKTKIVDERNEIKKELKDRYEISLSVLKKQSEMVNKEIREIEFILERIK